jgi:transcriptional regulator with XRE-family HTH domain
MGGDAPAGPPDLRAGATIGSVLAWYRNRAELKGQRLAELTGLSQAKVSRIETGKIHSPAPRDLDALIQALNIDDGVGRLLREEARRLREPAADWHEGPPTLPGRQQDTEQTEATARSFKIFQPTVIIGLVQTDGYAKAVLSALQNLMPGNGRTPPDAAVQEAVALRVHRQAVLLDPGKRFELIMTEDALRNRVCPPEEMPAQLLRLREAARRENVLVGLIPADTRWSIPPFHGFTLLDDRDLFVDLYDTGLSKHDKLDARFYLQVFEAMKKQAVTEHAAVDAILNRHLRTYLDLLQG